MKKLVLFVIGIFSPAASLGALTTDTLGRGSEIYLTVLGHCSEQPEILNRLESLFNEKIEAPLEEMAIEKTLKKETSRAELSRLQTLSRCFIDISEPETAAPFQTVEESNLPDFTFPTGDGFNRFDTGFYNDPLYKKQSFMTRIDAESAYRILTADSDFIKTPVRIGVIDEGPANDRHEDLAGQLLASSDVSRSGIKHGQHVLGIMAAKSGNSLGIAGVAGFNTQFIYRQMVYTKGKVNSAHIANTIREFGRLGVDAINLSIAIEGTCTNRSKGFDKCYVPIAASSVIKRAMQETARTYGTVFVISASNEAQSIASYSSPEDGIIVVGTSTSSGKVTDYSNHGPGVDIYVPETGIYGLTKEGYSNSLTGTSFAAPIVTAVAGLTRHYLRSRGSNPSAAAIARHILRNSTYREDLTRNGSSGRELNMGKVISTSLNPGGFRR